MKKTMTQHFLSVALLSLSSLWLTGLQADDACRKAKKELCAIEQTLTACGTITPIDAVPYIITQSGKYCVNADLTLPVGSTRGIVVLANNVTINFNNHSLTLDDPSAVGIYASGVNELAIKNDVIQASAVSPISLSAAIQLVGCNKVSLDNIYTLNTFSGVLIQSSSDVFITNSLFNNHTGGTGVNATTGSFGLNASASSNVVIENSTFSGINTTAGSSTGAIFFQGGCLDCRVSGCTLTNVDQSIAAYQIQGLIIEDSNFEQPAGAVYPMIQLGSPSPFATTANDVIIAGCTLVSASAASTSTIITAGQGNGYLIRDSVLDLNSSATVAPFPAGVGLSVASLNNNTTSRNCVIQTYTGTIGAIATNTAVSIANGAIGTVLDSCLLSGGQGTTSVSGVTTGGSLLIGAKDVVIKNSEVSSSTANGIEVQSTAVNIALINNTVRDNGTTTSTGNGIQIDAGATEVRLENNRVLSNTGNGILNLAPYTLPALPQIYFNTSCGNGNGTTSFDCSGFAQLSQTPGTLTPFVGGNVCCTITPGVA